MKDVVFIVLMRLFFIKLSVHCFYSSSDSGKHPSLITPGSVQLTVCHAEQLQLFAKKFRNHKLIMLTNFIFTSALVDTWTDSCRAQASSTFSCSSSCSFSSLSCSASSSSSTNTKDRWLGMNDYLLPVKIATASSWSTATRGRGDRGMPAISALLRFLQVLQFLPSFSSAPFIFLWSPGKKTYWFLFPLGFVHL